MQPNYESISTRRHARELVEEADELDEPLDLDEVEFVSRASGDELLYCADEHDVTLCNVRDPVRKMFEVIIESADLDERSIPDIEYA